MTSSVEGRLRSRNGTATVKTFSPLGQGGHGGCSHGGCFGKDHLRIAMVRKNVVLVLPIARINQEIEPAIAILHLGQEIRFPLRFLEHVDFKPEEAIAMSYALQVERQAPYAYAEQWVASNAARVEGWAKQ